LSGSSAPEIGSSAMTVESGGWRPLSQACPSHDSRDFGDRGRGAALLNSKALQVFLTLDQETKESNAPPLQCLADAQEDEVIAHAALGRDAADAPTEHREVLDRILRPVVVPRNPIMIQKGALKTVWAREIKVSRQRRPTAWNCASLVAAARLCRASCRSRSSLTEPVGSTSRIRPRPVSSARIWFSSGA
jgi:hypothetical protein